jgi:HTH-type transcriptional regulator/antitoxin HigA
MAESPQLFEMRPEHPGKYLREKMEAKGWTYDEVAAITGLTRQTVYNIISGKSNISPETAVRLAAAFGNTPQEWMKWDSLFRLAQAETDLPGVGKLARLYEQAPIRDMQKRGWIGVTAHADELEAELTKFFGRNPLAEDIALPIAAKRTIHAPELNIAEKAWCYRARQLARILPAAPFAPSKLDSTERKLRELAAFPKEARHVPKVLSECGIRFMVIEPIPGVEIDGATLWLETEPVIAISMRFDRIDGFWFTLMHEFAHVRNGDASVDRCMVDATRGITVKLVEDEAERTANRQAANSLIPETEMNSFVRRVGPFYSRARVIQFANRMKIHPGIIVGQLQYKEEIGYSSLREALAKVREVVTSTALTDGWEHSISPNVA